MRVDTGDLIRSRKGNTYRVEVRGEGVAGIAYLTNTQTGEMWAWKRDALVARMIEGAFIHVEDAHPEMNNAAREFVARWIASHNGWGDEGAYYNEIFWRHEMLPETVTNEMRESIRRHYGCELGAWD
jgi:hypothetical protein